jgi:hypothetical protein
MTMMSATVQSNGCSTDSRCFPYWHGGDRVPSAVAEGTEVEIPENDEPGSANISMITQLMSLSDWSMRRKVITEQLLDHWSAWFEDDPLTAFGGDSAATVTTRLLESRGISPNCLIPAPNPTLTRMAFHLATDPCPDCKGTGKYTGLNTVEECGTCGGSGARIW